ncbi:hypothetical protein J6590_062136 [Homalodisca vitripennis]|nr:hypothetical protein J6590_062136 [Homalodisca vitripennis]
MQPTLMLRRHRRDRHNYGSGKHPDVGNSLKLGFSVLSYTSNRWELPKAGCFPIPRASKDLLVNRSFYIPVTHSGKELSIV